MLWGRARNRCAFPDCDQLLIQDVPGDAGTSVIGEEAHIFPREAGGPRADGARPADVDAYSNLILLCPAHHKMVDDHASTYTMDVLEEMKRNHEAQVASGETPDQQTRQADDERYAAYVDEWVRRAALDSWDGWMSSLTSHGQPSLLTERYEQLEELREWLLRRIWPGRYEDLENSFHNFRFVLDDLFLVFSRHAEDPLEDRERIWTRKFYKIDEWNPELYERLGEEYDVHVDLVEDLALEMTRAANYVCDHVRKRIDPAFRVREGALVIRAGPMMETLGWTTFRPEYRREERTARPYPGLERFKADRASRDFCFGTPGND
jgi:hypothetical protein